MNQHDHQKMAGDYINCRRMMYYCDKRELKTDMKESSEHFRKRMLQLGLTEEDVELLTKGN